MKINDFFGNTIQKIKHFFSNLGDNGILTIWIAAILITGTLLWTLTAGSRANVMIKTVNKYLTIIGEERLIESPISNFAQSGWATQAGSWWWMTSREKAVIFPLIIDGAFAPCLGIINREGNLASITPLSKNAERGVDYMQTGYIQVWIDRIEKSAKFIQ
ncbi:hypothetical protein FACS1894190_05420 [Spirochaetia bacterium]|nr:hypothetical protein FACS1894190_05420 [Spirochaetia bacterium]